MAAKVVDMDGSRFGSVVGVSVVGPSKSRGLVWRFLCDCGELFDASGNEVRRGGITSCKKCADAKKAAQKTTHGLCKTPEYRTWSAMKRRCFNHGTEHFAEYGGRGITVCDRWQSFENFLADMGARPTPKHSIERVDNSGNYEPDNCKWETMIGQSNNKRNNRIIEINGEAMTLAQWSRKSGVNESTIRRRLSVGICGADLIKETSCK
jgi:hypothetical protein